MTMDGGERAQPHRGGSGGGTSGDLFICFTSRASSSMRIPSTKSLPSPGRKDGKFRDPVAVGAAGPALSASLSRRLRNSGTVKGGQSPAMFSSVGGSRKKGGGFEAAAEPTSPKVTCIGQVRVKTARKKKKKMMMRSRSKRVGAGGESSFRRAEQSSGEGGGSERECFPNRNQSWVHLPLGSICEAVKAFGSEMNCFLPCGGGGGGGRSSGGIDREKAGGGKRARMGSCGAAFSRWLMAIIQESEEEGKGEEVMEMGIVVGEMEERELREVELVADELERGVNAVERKEDIGEGEEEEVPVCVPPRNALLLMRCRSDPVRMSALANRFWGSPVAKVGVEDEEDEDDDDDNEEEGREEERSGNGRDGGVVEELEEEEKVEARLQDSSSACEMEEVEERVEFGDKEMLEQVPAEAIEEVRSSASAENGDEELERKQSFLHQREDKEHEFGNVSSDGAQEMMDKAPKQEEEEVEVEKASTLDAKEAEKQVVGESHSEDAEEEKENKEVQLQDRGEEIGEPRGGEKKKTNKSGPIMSEKEERRWSFSKDREARRHSFSTEKDARRSSSFREKEGRRSSFSSEGDSRRFSFSVERKTRRRRRAREAETEPAKVLEEVVKDDTATREEEKPAGSVVVQPSTAVVDVKRRKEAEEKSNELPDCLLMMMMYEPKLSMEVSKETWVCNADFVRWKPRHRRPQCPKDQNNGSNNRPEAVEAKDGECRHIEKEKSVMTGAIVVHPPPPPPELVKAVELKLGSATAAAVATSYGPFMLTRCKSEPMRSSSAKMLPDACFWKSRHQPIGAGGIGF